MSATAPNSILISSVPDLKTFISSIPPSGTLYVDLEGTNLSRHGTISLMTILVHPQKTTRIIDVFVLGSAAFTTAAENGKSIKTIFENAQVSKCFWDVRNDADALWALYKVNLAGVIDVQLLENASRTGNKTYVRGLDKCVQYDLKPRFMELERWIRVKKDKQKLFSTNAFTTRPLEPKTVQYCVNDVTYLPDLQALYLKRIGAGWLGKAIDESSRRVIEAQSATYDPQSPTKPFGPWATSTAQDTLTMEEFFERFEEDRMDEMQREMLGEAGYYDDDDDYDSYSDYRMNSKDAELFPGDWDSCWDRGGS